LLVCLQELSSVLSSVRVEPPTQQALSKAKSGLLNSFVFNFASCYSQLQRTLVYQLLGLPPVSMNAVQRGSTVTVGRSKGSKAGQAEPPLLLHKVVTYSSVLCSCVGHPKRDV
jgi:hypothetical protein